MGREERITIDRRLGQIHQMANPRGAPQNLRPAWERGHSGNPGGKPEGARNRLQSDFLHALADDFDAHGISAIKRCREETPAAYLRIIASLMPAELEVVRPLDELSDAELNAAIIAIRAIFADQDNGAKEPKLLSA